MQTTNYFFNLSSILVWLRVQTWTCFNWLFLKTGIIKFTGKTKHWGCILYVSQTIVVVRDTFLLSATIRGFFCEGKLCNWKCFNDLLKGCCVLCCYYRIDILWETWIAEIIVCKRFEPALFYRQPPLYGRPHLSCFFSKFPTFDNFFLKISPLIKYEINTKINS